MASAVITGLGNYTGSVVKKFIIEKAEKLDCVPTNFDVEYSVKTISNEIIDKYLAENYPGWKSVEFPDRELAANDTISVVVIYEGADASNYENTAADKNVKVKGVLFIAKKNVKKLVSSGLSKKVKFKIIKG